jgi:hypothetical protein
VLLFAQIQHFAGGAIMTSAPATREQKQASYLITESPLVVLPTLANALGINKAIVIQQLHFLLNNQKTSKNTFTYVDGHWWVYNSYLEWQRDYFTWMSVSSIKGVFRELERDGLVIAKQSVKYKSDRRKWYTIDYDRWDNFCLMIGQKLSDEPLDKKSPIIGQNLSDGLSDTTSENTNDSSESKNPLTPVEPESQTPEPAESKAATERGGEGGGKPEKAQQPKPEKTPDYLKHPHLYAQEPVSDEQFQDLPLAQRTTAMMSAICWHVERSAKAPADVEKIVYSSKSGMERAFLHHFRAVHGATPRKLMTFIAEYRKDEYGSKAKNPALIASRFRDWIEAAANPGESTTPPTPRIIKRPLATCPRCNGEGHFPDPKDRNSQVRCNCWHDVTIDGVAS